MNEEIQQHIINNKVRHLNALLVQIRELKDANPGTKTAYPLHIGGLLNAYREGDIGFDECVTLISAYLSSKGKQTRKIRWKS